MALPPTLPSIFGSARELTPQISDTKTSGTTSIFSSEINTCPTTLKAPSINQIWDHSGVPRKVQQSSGDPAQQHGDKDF